MIKLCIFIFFLFSVFSEAFGEKTEVWMNGYIPPMCYVENNQVKGYGVEIVQAVFEEAAIDYHLRIAPWKRAFFQAKNGNGIVAGMYWTTERSMIFDYTKPLWEEKVVLVTRTENKFPFNTIQDLKGKIVGLQRGTRPGDEFTNAIKSGLLTLLEDSNPLSRIKMLYMNRTDVAIFNPGAASVRWNIKKANLSLNAFTVLPKPLAIVPKHIGIAKSLNRKDLIEKINIAIRKLSQTRKVNRILRKYE